MVTKWLLGWLLGGYYVVARVVTMWLLGGY